MFLFRKLALVVVEDECRLRIQGARVGHRRLDQVGLHRRLDRAGLHRHLDRAGWDRYPGQAGRQRPLEQAETDKQSMSMTMCIYMIGMISLS